jgi:putative SOS response-associated peptidase YedK
MNNARAETITEKPSYRQLAESKIRELRSMVEWRCAVRKKSKTLL